MLIPGKQRHVILHDGEPLEGVDKFKHLISVFVVNGRGTVFRILSPVILSLVVA